MPPFCEPRRRSGQISSSLYKAQHVQAHTLRALRGNGISLYNYYPDTSAFAQHGRLLARSLPEYDCVFYTKRFWDQDVRQRVSLRESAYIRHGYDGVIHRPIEWKNATKHSIRAM